MNNNELTPCGDDRLDCIDCCGLGACEYTKGKDNPDQPLSLEKALKETLGIDIEAIKKIFNQ